MSVVQKDGRWYIRETTGPDTFEDSVKSWGTKADAESMMASLQKLKDATPDQGERREMAVAADTLAKMKNGGRRRRH
jgi:hypothetical protein